jgi:pilus assembly protein CpaF
MSRETIYEASVDYFLAPIGPYLADDAVTEIMVNNWHTIYIERHGRLEKTDAQFESEDALLSAVNNVAQWVGRTIDEKNPILDARLPNGSRVHCIIPPGCRTGVCLTIRKFRKGGMSLGDLIRLGSLSESASEFLELCVRLRKNTVVSGGTGTGKTVLLGAMAVAIPEVERVVVIEDTSELRLPQEHCVYLEVQRPDQFGRGGLGIRQLFIASLRMRPDRIIVGEVRSGEALDMVQSMLSGHAGSLTTVHANTAHDALVRLETLSLMADVDIPVYVARAQVAAAMHLVVQLERFSADGSRRVSRISEIRGLDDNNNYIITDLFRLKLEGQTPAGRLIANLAPTGELPTFAHEVYDHGLEDYVGHSEMMWKKR